MDNYKPVNDPFEDLFQEVHCLEYYSGIDNPTIEQVNNPNNLWSILDRLDTMVLDNENLSDDQREFLQGFLSHWKKEIEPFCDCLYSE